MVVFRGHGDCRGLAATVVTVALVLAAVAVVLKVVQTPGPPPQPDNASAAATVQPSPRQTPGRSPTAGATVTAQQHDAFGPILRPSPPTALSIPSIGVQAKGIVDLHLDAHGKLQAPADFNRAGWYADGPTPGEFGPAVIGAHVDSRSGPAVFYRLGSLSKGAEVRVTRKDGTTARFVVDRVARYAKDDFPTSEVYGDTKGRAELRLITCGGAFDRAIGHYVDNVVAFAHLVR